jgi:hypothetical protein
METNYNFIVPTNQHQGEEPSKLSYDKVDTFMKDLVEGQIMANSAAWKRGTAVIFMLWDESNLSHNAPSGLIAISPNSKKGASKTAYTHLSMVKTVAKVFGVTPPVPTVGTKPDYAAVADLADMFTAGTLF